jgi:predicted DNA-binding ribbon-helix-helix protein
VTDDVGESADATAPAGPVIGARPVKHSFSIAGHRTSISLEAAFWQALRDAAARRQLALAALVAEIDAGRGEAGLSSAIRVWILADLQSRADDRSGPATFLT